MNQSASHSKVVKNLNNSSSFTNQTVQIDLLQINQKLFLNTSTSPIIEEEHHQPIMLFSPSGDLKSGIVDGKIEASITVMKPISIKLGSQSP